MSKLVICRTDEVGGDFATRAVVDDKAYAVYKLGDEYFVSVDECNHGPGSLGEGTIIGEEIECPFHQGRFFIRTGQASYPPCTEPMKVWPGHVDGDDIWIELEP
jgi:ethylbenzene dioxygenase ferredoxin component